MDRYLAKAFNETTKRLKVETPDSSGGLLAGVQFNDIQVSYPTSTTEIYSYYQASVLQAEVELTFSDNTKKTLTRARRLS